MTNNQAKEVLREMQRWRREQPPYDAPGAKMPYEPAVFGQAIDVAIDVLRNNQKQ